MNVVMTGSGGFIEVRAPPRGALRPGPARRALGLAEAGIARIGELQASVLATPPEPAPSAADRGRAPLASRLGAGVVLASANPKKAAELPPSSATVPLVPRPPEVPEVVEDADTFEGNARLKAAALAAATGLVALADDSGLEVGALDGARECARPGSREVATDEANTAALLAALEACRPVLAVGPVLLRPRAPRPMGKRSWSTARSTARSPWHPAAPAGSATTRCSCRTRATWPHLRRGVAKATPSATAARASRRSAARPGLIAQDSLSFLWVERDCKFLHCQTLGMMVGMEAVSDPRRSGVRWPRSDDGLVICADGVGAVGSAGCDPAGADLERSGAGGLRVAGGGGRGDRSAWSAPGGWAQERAGDGRLGGGPVSRGCDAAGAGGQGAAGPAPRCCCRGGGVDQRVGVGSDREDRWRTVGCGIS